ncbi:hypothetical protein ACU4GA_02835 [Methylobacterium oryzae CBMB20]
MPAPLATRAPGSPTARAAAPWADLTNLLSSDARLFAFAKRAARALVPFGLAMVLLVYGTGPEPRRNWYGDPSGTTSSRSGWRAVRRWRGAERSPTTYRRTWRT